MTNHFNFNQVQMAPADPILGVTEQFLKDPNPNKVNLGVGVYQNEEGKPLKLKSVIKAETLLLENDKLAGYSAIDGLIDYRTYAQNLILGENHEAVKNDRVYTIQSPGGTGAIRLGAEFLKLFGKSKDVYISSPTWDNHRAIFRSTDFNTIDYPYYDEEKKGVNFNGCLKSLNKASAGSILVIHACCHNPTGYDFSNEQWKEILELIEKKSLIPFLDIAYQGFSESLYSDSKIIQELALKSNFFLVAQSFSKNMGLYAERTGALHIITDGKDSTLRIQSQLKQIVRAMYSNPPARGAKIVNSIMENLDLKTEWIKELDFMRERVKKMRKSFFEKISQSKSQLDFSHVLAQNGMFSYSGLTKEQVAWLKLNRSIYALDSGRICVAALNLNNIDYVVNSIAEATLAVS